MFSLANLGRDEILTPLFIGVLLLGCIIALVALVRVLRSSSPMHPTTLILVYTFIVACFGTGFVRLLLGLLLPTGNEWALMILSGIIAGFTGSIIGIWGWAREVLHWAKRVDAWRKELIQQVNSWGETVEQKLTQLRVERESHKQPEKRRTEGIQAFQTEPDAAPDRGGMM
jgi:hypothetical protein